MVWLRDKEKILRAQSKAATYRELEREVDAMKVIIDQYKTGLEYLFT